MIIKHRIWKLLTKKLSDEASEQELNELNGLLRQHPNIDHDVKWMFDWWQDEEKKIDNQHGSLFSKIQKQINQAE
jgi:hypothetical protein